MESTGSAAAEQRETPPSAPAPRGAPLALGGRALAALLLATLAWAAFVYAATYPHLKAAWKNPEWPRLPSEVHWDPHWLALPLAALALLAAHGVGRRLVRALEPRDMDDPEAQALSIPVGLAALALGLFALACVHLLRAPWIAALWAVAMAIGGGELRAAARRLRRPRSPSVLAAAAGALLAVQGVAAAVVTTAPELFFDGPHYHLFPVDTYVRAGGFAPVPGFVPLHLPELAHLLFAGVYAFAGSAGTRALSLLVGVWVVGFAAWAATRLATRRAGWLAALVLGSTPVFVSTATASMPDLVLTTMAVAGLWLALRHGGCRRGAILAGLLAGAAAATKIVGCVLAASIVVVCAARAARAAAPGRRARAAAGAAGAASVAAAAVAVPFFAKSWIAIGNPLFPALGAVFGYHILTESETKGLTAFYFSLFGMGRGARAMLLLPWNVTVHGGRFSGMLGAFWLSALPLVTLGWKDRRVRALLAAVCLAWIAMATSQHVQRYFFPGLVLLAVVLAVVIDRLGQAGGTGRVARAAIVGVALATALVHLPFFHRAWLRAWFPYELEEIPLARAFGAESEDAYLTRRFSACRPLAARHAGTWGSARLIAVPPFQETPAMWFEGRLIDNFPGARVVARAAAEHASAERMAAVLEREGITHVLVEGPLKPGDPFSEESPFAAAFLRRLDAAGPCTLYALGPRPPGPRTDADLVGRASAIPKLPDGVLVRPVVRAGVDAREAIIVEAPRELAFPLTIPRGASLDAALAMAAPGGDGAVAVAWWREGGRSRELARVPLPAASRLDAPGDGWVPLRVDLGPLQGHSGELVLASEPGPSGDRSADWVAWGWPRIRTGAPSER